MIVRRAWTALTTRSVRSQEISVDTTQIVRYHASTKVYVLNSLDSPVPDLTTTLLIVPLEDTVVFPTMDVTLPVDVGDEERVLLVPRHEGSFASVGTIARVAERVRLPGGLRGAQLEGEARGVAGAAHTDPGGRLRIEVTEARDAVPVDGRTRTLERELRAVYDEILELRGDDGRVSQFLRAITEPGTLADASGYSPDLAFDDKVKLLETIDVTERLELALSLQRERLAELQVRRRIRDDVESGAQKQQREYILRKQMESIRKELGDDDGSVIEEYRTKIEESGMPEAVREQAERELARFERAGEQSGESQMIRNYLDWLIAVPWSEYSEEDLGGRELWNPRARCSTPTTPASRTSRTGSPSTWRCASCARSAGSRPIRRPARS
jgi:ATP-dependent Lon protease